MKIFVACPSVAAGIAIAALAAMLAPAPANAGCPPTPREQDLCLPVGQTSLSMDAYGHFEWRASRASAATADEFVDSAASDTNERKFCRDKKAVQENQGDNRGDLPDEKFGGIPMFGDALGECREGQKWK